MSLVSEFGKIEVGVKDESGEEGYSHQEQQHAQGLETRAGNSR